MTEMQMQAQLDDLESLDMKELRARWRELFDIPPPPYSKALMVGRIGYRIQELVRGGLAEWAKEELAACVPEGSIDTDAGTVQRMRRRKHREGLAVGTRLVREFDGERHEVVVTRQGFEWQGRAFRSLSAVAREITGTNWNGPKFFGLRRGGR